MTLNGCKHYNVEKTRLWKNTALLVKWSHQKIKFESEQDARSNYQLQGGQGPEEQVNSMGMPWMKGTAGQMTQFLQQKLSGILKKRDEEEPIH